MIAASSELVFPSLEFFAFIPPVFLQCLLLHPAFPDAVSRPLRLILVLPALKYAFTTPFTHGFEPRSDSVGINFVLGVLATYAAWKSLEFGCISDRTPYTWTGLDSDLVVSSADGKTKVPLRKDRARLDAVRRKRAETDSPYDVLLNSLHLLISMRGIGYAFGPSVRTLSKTAYAAESFMRDNLVQYAWSHAAIVLCTSILTSPPPILTALISSYIPALSPSAVSNVAATLSTAALGLGAYAGLQLGHTTFTLLMLLISTLASYLPFSIPFLPPFDRRQYHRLFVTPYRLSSVSQFWSQDWHSFFARPFKVLGMDFPMVVIEGLGGSTALARAVGVMTVFALSGWLHEQALYSSTTHLPPFDPPLTFVVRWGGTLYFLLNGFAILLEQAFTRITRRQVGGPFGTLWTSFWVIGLGYLVWRSWITLGLTDGMPDTSRWTWHRYLLPLTALMPPGLFTK